MSKRHWSGVLVGLMGLSGGLLSAPIPDPKDGRPAREIEAARELLGQIVKASAEPRVDAEQLGRLWQQMLARFAGTPEWKEAAGVIRRSPSLLDRLQRQQIPELDRPSWLPADVVAVLGENRGRHWGGVRPFPVAISADGQLLASGGNYKTGLCIWEVATLGEWVTLPSWAQALAWSRKGRVLALGMGKQVQLWDVRNKPGRLLATLEGHSTDIRSLVFPPDGKALVSCAQREVIFWDLSGDQPRKRRQVNKAGADDGEEILSPDGRFAVGYRKDEPGELWRLDENADHKAVVLENSGSQGYAFSPDGKKLVTPVVAKFNVVAIARFQVLDLTVALPKVERLVEYHPEDRCWDSFCFSSDGELLVGTGSDMSIALLPLTEKKRQQLGVPRGQSYRKHRLTSDVGQLTILPGDKTLVLSGGEIDQSIRFFDVETGKEHFRQVGHRYAAGIGDIARDGHTLATDAVNGEIRLWDLTATQRENAILNRPFEMRKRRDFSPVNALAFSSDGRFLLTVWDNAPNPMRIWDLSQVNPPKPKIIPLGSFQALVCLISPVGSSVAILGQDQPTPEEHVPAIQLWSWKDDSLRLTQRLAVKSQNPNQPAVFTSGRYSPDGKLLAFQVGLQEIAIWDVRSAPAKYKASIVLADPDSLGGFAFSADSQKLVTASGEITNAVQRPYKLRLRWWDLGGEKPIPRKVWLDRSNSYFCRLAMSPDGQFLAVASSVDLCIWSVADGNKIKSWQLPGICGGVRFAPDSRHLLTGNANGSIYVWRLAEPKARTP